MTNSKNVSDDVISGQQEQEAGATQGSFVQPPIAPSPPAVDRHISGQGPSHEALLVKRDLSHPEQREPSRDIGLRAQTRSTDDQKLSQNPSFTDSVAKVTIQPPVREAASTSSDARLPKFENMPPVSRDEREKTAHPAQVVQNPAPLAARPVSHQISENVEPVDPLKRLAEIVSQAPQAAQGQTDTPVSQEGMTPDPVAMLDRVVPPRSPLSAEKDKKKFRLFGRKQIQRAEPESAPSAPAPTEDQETEKKTSKLFRRRKDKRDSVEVERHRRTSREKRWHRRRRRVWFEELLGWIFVPIILFAIYWCAIGVLDLFGMTPDTVISGIQKILGGRS